MIEQKQSTTFTKKHDLRELPVSLIGKPKEYLDEIISGEEEYDTLGLDVSGQRTYDWTDNTFVTVVKSVNLKEELILEFVNLCLEVEEKIIEENKKRERVSYKSIKLIVESSPMKKDIGFRIYIDSVKKRIKELEEYKLKNGLK